MRLRHLRACPVAGAILSVVVALYCSRINALEPPVGGDSGAIVVRVLDEAGVPQAGAVVSLFTVDGRSQRLSDAKREVRSDPSGVARLDQLPASGKYKLRATMGDGLVGYRECSLNGDKSRPEIDLHVLPISAATIHVRDDKGKPIRGATIWALWNNSVNGAIGFGAPDLQTCGLASKPSNDAGELVLPMLPRGKTGFKLVHPDYAPADVEGMAVEPGATTDVVMPAGVKLTISFKAHDIAPPIDRLQIRLANESIFHPSTLFGQLPPLRADGTIELTVARGKYQSLRFSHPDFTVTPEYYIPYKPFELQTEGNRFTFQLRKKVKAHGRILEESGGKPVADRFVWGQVDAGSQDGPFARFASRWTDVEYGTSDDRGDYEMKLPVGPARIHAILGGVVARSEYEEVNVAADGSTVFPDIMVRPIPKVRGVVHDQKGQPMPRAIVRFRDSDLAWDYPVVTDAQGRFELSPDNLPTELLSDKPKSLQAIVAFHPYAPLGATAHVNFSDPKSLDDVMLQMVPQDYSFPVTGFPDESAELLRELSPEGREQRAAMSRGGAPAPELDGAVWLNTDRPKMSLTDFRGKFVLLQFWTTWCGVCHGDMPQLNLAYNLYKEKGLAVICVHDNSVAVDEVKKYVAEQKLPYPVVVDQLDGRILESYKPHGVRGYPSYILIGPDGTILGDPTGTCKGVWLFKLEVLRQQLMTARGDSAPL